MPGVPARMSGGLATCSVIFVPSATSIVSRSTTPLDIPLTPPWRLGVRSFSFVRRHLLAKPFIGTSAGKDRFMSTTERLQGMKVAILVADGFEQVEMTEPRRALDDAGAETGSDLTGARSRARHESYREG